PKPTSFCLIDAPPLDGKVCLEISPLIIYPIIDRLLGGSNQDLFIPQRPMTAIETSLISVILSRATSALQEAWSGIRDIAFALSEMESNPQLVQIVPPNEVVVVIGFEIKMTTRAGTMNLCIPFNVIEPLMEELSAQSWFNVDKARRSKHFEDRVTESLSGALLDVNAVLAETTMTLEDLMRLSIGDVIMADKPVSSSVVLCVEGQRKFTAQIGQHRGNRALRIVKSCGQNERV
ncbi:MAG: flagellar motor switch protein FliM, partial [Planctomycetota bacterium]